jgi:hypothetical protein
MLLPQVPIRNYIIFSSAKKKSLWQTEKWCRFLILHRFDLAAHSFTATSHAQPIEAVSLAYVNFSLFLLTRSMPQCNAFKA